METITESFEVTIKRIRTVKKLVKGAWVVTGTEEVERDKRYTFGENEPKTRLEEKRGYAPDREDFVTEEHVTYNQRVDKLDMGAVIKAVNGMQ